MAMKFPQLFGRTPSYRRFEYKPRFYDPRKEEREDRERRIREELAIEKDEATENLTDHRLRMKGAFHRNRRRSKPASETSPVLLRLAVLLFIALFLIGYLTWGNVALYSLVLVFPVWIYFRFLRNR
jgi:Flp pilus assembly protein TadB